MATKYTRQCLEPLLPKAHSFNELARLVGIAPIGSNTINLKRRCSEYGLDTSHMTGQAHNRGKHARNKKHFSEILVEGHPIDVRVPRRQLLRAMIESGIEYTCSTCQQKPIWCGKTLTLQIDHKDGRYWNNKLDNLRFLCPHCHSQTETWGR